MKLFSCELTPNNKIKLVFLGIKLKISVKKNRFDVLKRRLYIIYSKLSAFFDKNIKTRKYEIVIPLGKDCELATNYKYFFSAMMDATLYNWSAYIDKKAFIEGIKHPENICSGEISFGEEHNTWRCMATTNLFHGNSQPEDLMDKNGAIIPEKRDKEREAVINKIHYLIDKNDKYYHSPDKKLYMFTYNIENVSEDTGYLKELYNYFKSCNDNFDMVVIVEEDKLSKELKDFESEFSNIYIRKVPYFRDKTPDSISFTYPYFRDWGRVFAEFKYSSARKKTAKKLKSELKSGI